MMYRTCEVCGEVFASNSRSKICDKCIEVRDLHSLHYDEESETLKNGRKKYKEEHGCAGHKNAAEHMNAKDRRKKVAKKAKELNEIEALGRAQGKSYGQIIAEKYAKEHPIVRKALNG